MNARIEHQDWISVIATTAAADPGRTAFTFSGTEGEPPEVMTYGRLDRLARATAARLAREGAAGRPVLLLQPPGFDYVVSFVACLYAGAVAVPVYPPTRRPRSVERLASIVMDCGATLALTTARVRDKLLPGDPDGLLMDTLRLLATDLVPEAEADAWTRPPVDAGTTAFLQYTSGSTAAPRGVLLTHGNLLHNSSVIQRAFRTTSATVGMSWLPLFHDMGLIGGMLQPLYYAGSCALMSPAEFGRDPMRWLREISRSGATVSGGPNFAYDLCADLVTPELLDGLDLSRWEVAFNGAEPIRAETLERFSTAFAGAGFRAEAFTPCYGLAEASLIVSCKPHGTAPVRLPAAEVPSPAAPDGGTAEAAATAAFDLVGSGHPDGTQRLEIVDPLTARRAANGAVGEIWVSGPSVARAYWNREEQSEAVFGARLAEEGPDGARFLRTGDLGMLRDGELFVTGRLKDLIVVRGRNHYPQDIERTVEGVHPALKANCGAAVQAVADGEEHVVVVHEVARDHQDEDLAALAREVRAAVSEEHGVRPLAVVLIRAATLPRTSSGKVQRHACAASYLDGGLTVLAVDGHLPGRDEDGTGRDAGPADASRLPVPAPSGADLAALRAAAPEHRHAPMLAVLRVVVARRLGTRPDALVPGERLAVSGLDSLGAARLRHDVRDLLDVDLGLDEALDADLPGLARLLAERMDTPVPDRPEDKVEDSAPGDHPLSRNQASLWFQDRMVPESPANLVSACFGIRGPVDPGALLSAFELICARHAALRSTFPVVDGEPVQRVHASLPPSFEHVDLSDADADADADADGGTATDALAHRVARAAEEPFDLDTGPLLRVRLFSRGDEHTLVLTVHHLVSDLWSLSLLLDELDTAYPAALCGRAAELPAATAYPVFTRRQALRLASPAGGASMDRWAELLADATRGTSPPADRPRRAVPRMRGAALPFTVDAATTTALTALARREGTTLYSVLLAAYQVLLARCTGSADVVVGTPVHGRADADLAATVGCLVNTVPLRTVVDPEESFTRLLHRVHLTALPALRGDDVPFASLVERLGPARDHSARPVVRTLLTLQQAPGERADAVVSLAVNRAGTPFTLGGLACTTRSLPATSSQFDVQLTFGQVGGELAGSVRYDTDLYDPRTAGFLADRMGALLAALATDTDVPVGELPALGAAESRLLADEWNATDAPHDERAGVVERFEAVAARSPHAVAVLAAGSGEGPIDYARLDRLANGIAHRLRDAGVGPGDIVAVLLPRTPALLAALLGVLKSGAAYLPLDPGLPAARLSFLLADASAAAVLTDDPDLSHDRILRPDGSEAEHPPARAAHPAAPAYVIYTSGSTGTPKGVVVPHAALANLIAAMGRDLPIAAGDGWLSVTTPSFDIAALEYFLPLVSGATVHLADEETAAQGARLRACLDTPGITHLQATPVTWQLLLDAGWTGTPGLTALCGGERMPGGLTRELPSRGAELWNVYGPTETTVWSLSTRVTDVRDDVPLGTPLANTRVHVLDAGLRPLPVGATGELYIGGDGLAHGYLGRPGLTAERFLPDPFAARPGDRLYRTGDLVRRCPDGGIAFVGRTDSQVKVHGHRIELGEIETALERLPSVRRAAVTVDGEGSDARLLAHVEPAAGGADPHGLREELRAWLPGYAVPSLISVTDSLPLTPNGKVDRGALPAPEEYGDAARGPEFEAPRTPAEQRVAAIVSDLLPDRPIGRTDDLFDLGAHSLVMSRLVERVRAEFGTVPPLGRLFEKPTVAAIAGFVDERAQAPGEGPSSGRPVLRRADRSRHVAGRSADGGLLLPAGATVEQR
ncbi:amino acid adenylation domain-containing protein [Streptomyces fructofermentans]|uniref:amino acid adenylation domain-containing protein n=1 Tax=Streptomyces fructofermentans TaxID=152141 RepID=UPI00379D6952